MQLQYLQQKYRTFIENKSICLSPNSGPLSDDSQLFTLLYPFSYIRSGRVPLIPLYPFWNFIASLFASVSSGSPADLHDEIEAYWHTSRLSRSPRPVGTGGVVGTGDMVIPDP